EQLRCRSHRDIDAHLEWFGRSHRALYTAPVPQPSRSESNDAGYPNDQHDGRDAFRIPSPYLHVRATRTRGGYRRRHDQSINHRSSDHWLTRLLQAGMQRDVGTDHAQRCKRHQELQGSREPEPMANPRTIVLEELRQHSYANQYESRLPKMIED